MFELAHTGTLFLDEIAGLDPRMQVKLLRVLDGVPYYRLGSRRKTQVEVRLIAATSQDLEQRVADGLFRADLYDRLSEYLIRVPPLRERLDGLLTLAEYFLAQHSAQAGFSSAAAAALHRYPWPGNVPELRRVVADAVISARQYEIGPADFPLRLSGRSETPRGFGLEAIEREAILTALARTEGHHRQAADLLGIPRRSLDRKLRAYRREMNHQPAGMLPQPEMAGRDLR